MSKRKAEDQEEKEEYASISDKLDKIISLIEEQKKADRANMELQREIAFQEYIRCPLCKGVMEWTKVDCAANFVGCETPNCKGRKCLSKKTLRILGGFDF